ncbi:MAG: hypothetical protein E3J72_21920 [Planctomycetota bacterium]|nr:MAG: hypothetical protein E3J72_21920 [Planctomycetota bacterium]
MKRLLCVALVVAAAFVSTGCKKKKNYFFSPGAGTGPGAPVFTQISADGGRVAWYKGPAAHELIAFDAVTDDVFKNTSIFTMQPDGSALQNVTLTNIDVPAGFVGQPEWHPDGDHIIFQAENANASHTVYTHVSFGINNDLWIINKDGSGAEKIWETPLHHGALHPHFNDNGTILIWSERIATGVQLFPLWLTPGGENPWAGWQIHIADYDGNASGTAKLTNHRTIFGAGLPEDRGGFETHGFVDGDTIIFSRTLDGQAYVDDVFTSKLDGSGLTNLTNSPATWDEHGLYSPSGATLAFNSSRFDASWVAPSSNASTLKLELYLQKGADIIKLTDFNGAAPAGVRYLTSDFEWDRTGSRLVLQAAPVDSSGALPVEIWVVSFPSPQ